MRERRPRSTRVDRDCCERAATRGDHDAAARGAPAGRWHGRNPAVGLRNAIAPPMDIHHEDDGRCWASSASAAAYEGPPGLVHGGICALVLDHILGEAASDGLTQAEVHRHHHAALPAWHAAGAVARRGLHRTRSRASRHTRAASSQRRRRRHRRGRRRLHPAGVGAGRRMKFYVSTAFLDTREVVEIAKAADDLGYDGMGIPDHVINLETLRRRTRTPRTARGAGSRSPTGPTRG